MRRPLVRASRTGMPSGASIALARVKALTFELPNSCAEVAKWTLIF
jgi:hypothetical protein